MQVPTGAALVGAAVLGSGLALGVAGGLGRLGSTTTIQQSVEPAAPASDAAFATGTNDLTVAQVYRRAAPGVVQITATSVQTQLDPFGFFPPTTHTAKALGSGFVVDKAGHIITNEHVIADAQRIQVSFSGSDELNARVVGTDPSTDVAVLQVDARSRSLTPLRLGDSDTVQVGDPVVAIGNPFSLTRTATAGIVSAIQRTIDSPNGLTIDHVIQTDAAINHGNSGGPLLDAHGDVIGVNAQIQSGDTGGNLGIGFAIPINTVKGVVAQLIRSGKVEHAYLGLGAIPVTAELARLFNLPTTNGLLVQQVTAGSPADLAGLRAGLNPVIVEGESYLLGGDIVVGANGAPISTQQQLRDLLARQKPGDMISLLVYRGTAKTTVHVRLAVGPA